MCIRDSLWAGAAVGVSHLVQSTRAGASFGLGLVVVVLAANFFKYPAFQFGPRYAAATGTILLEGQGHTALSNVEAFSGGNGALTTLNKSQDFLLVRGDKRLTVSMVGCRMRNYAATEAVTADSAAPSASGSQRLNSGATKNCAKRSSAGTRLSGSTSKK